MDIHDSGDLKSILNTLIHMEELEQIVSEFYTVCSDIWPADRIFWAELSDEEREHRNNIATMHQIISKKPEHFEKGRPFNIFAIQTMLTGLRNNIKKIRNHDLSENNALSIARDIEQSFIEFRYSEIVKTADIEYGTLVQKIVKETAQHKIKIDQKIKGQ